MRQYVFFFLLCIMGLLCAVPARAYNIDYNIDIQCLRESYPHDIQDIFADDTGRIWLHLRHGYKVLYDDGRDATLPPNMDAATVRQSMAQIYPLESTRTTPTVGHPGRVRSYPLLHALYGQDATSVTQDIQKVYFLGKWLKFSPHAGAATALARVNTALTELLQREPQLRSYIVPPGGTFMWRRIAGEKRLSGHSFAMAIDLNPARGAYWRWAGSTEHPCQQNYPAQIVKIFEDNGFIWGGKWQEYDCMHFEYRPELICKAKRLSLEKNPRP